MQLTREIAFTLLNHYIRNEKMMAHCLASVKSKSVVKRMKEKSFADSVNRENILECLKIGLSLEAFTEICIHSMLPVSKEIGL